MRDFELLGLISGFLSTVLLIVSLFVFDTVHGGVLLYLSISLFIVGTGCISYSEWKKINTPSSDEEGTPLVSHV